MRLELAGQLRAKIQRQGRPAPRIGRDESPQLRIDPSEQHLRGRGRGERGGLGLMWRRGDGLLARFRIRRGWGGRRRRPPSGQLPQPHVVRVFDHDRAGGQVAQALALAIDEQDHEAHAIPVRQEVDDPNHVPDAGLEERHGLAAIADRAQPEHLLADRLSGPESLARPEIAEDDDETAEHPNQKSDRRAACLADRDRGERDSDQHAGQDQQVEDLGDRAGAEPGHLVLERNPLRGGDDEVGIGERLVHLLLTYVSAP